MSKYEDIWDQGYSKFYPVVTELVPYKEHMRNLFNLLKPTNNENILDLGCGIGNFLEMCNKIGAQTFGIDNSTIMINIAKNRVTNNTNILKHDLNSPIPLPSNFFDKIVSNNVLGFLTNRTVFLDELFRVLKPGGTFVLSTMRSTFSPKKIFIDHLKKSRPLEIFRILVPSLVVGYYNARITHKLRVIESQNGYQAYEANNFKEELRYYPIGSLSFTYSYANQDIVAYGQKST